MIITVTGTPCTGKTKVSKELSKKYKLKYLDVNKLIEDEGLSEGYDRKLKSKIVDVKKLNKKLVEIIKENKNLVIDSHLSHYLDKKYVDLCVVVKCGLEKLKKRLEKRKYSKKKIRDNLDSEIFDVCLVEALEKGHKIKVIDTTKGIKGLKI
ncbi:hypothetical protein CL618_00690 [archaeon]|nr:hypothetical protein [archaeon]|tara:strand:- start:2148 stop:2603 length:456 start_codon:yes stop_codon:yes gene_type:complete